MWALQQTSLPLRRSLLLQQGEQGALRTHQLSLGATCRPAVTGLGTLLTFSHFIHSVKPISELAKSKLKKHSAKTASKWQSNTLTLFLSGSETSPADHAIFHTPHSDPDTPGHLRLQVAWGPALWPLLEVVRLLWWA